MRIFIIGMPGTGKTFIGRLLSRSMKMQFRDLDEWVEKQEGMPIRQIVLEKGEPYFRQLEREGLLNLIKTGNTVVSCGGGAPVFYDNMELMKKNGIVVWINTDLGIIAARIAHNISRRPMFIGMSEAQIREKLGELYENRRKIYAKSDVVCEIKSYNTNSLNTVIQKVVKFVQRKIK